MSSDTAFDELSLMARYTSFSTYFTITLSLLTLGALVVSIFPQAETAKWLSRMIWVGWLATWGFGVFGICAYLSADSFVKAGCRMDQECWTYREKLRVRVILVSTLRDFPTIRANEPLRRSPSSPPSPSSSTAPSSSPPSSTFFTHTSSLAPTRTRKTTSPTPTRPPTSPWRTSSSAADTLLHVER